MATSDYRRYYNLERYLFEEVTRRFREQGFLDAFDFFSIVIWKANRAKSRIAKKLLRAASPTETLDQVCRRLTAAIHGAIAQEERFTLIVSAPWKFGLPMASAVLAVLYPDEFTVYDYRVCGELNSFQNLGKISDARRLWLGYRAFRDAVEASSSGLGLRDKDRALVGRSIAVQLEADIEDRFRRTSDGA